MGHGSLPCERVGVAKSIPSLSRGLATGVGRKGFLWSVLICSENRTSRNRRINQGIPENKVNANQNKSEENGKSQQIPLLPTPNRGLWLRRPGEANSLDATSRKNRMDISDPWPRLKVLTKCLRTRIVETESSYYRPWKKNYVARREFKGQQNRGNRTESLWEEICLWEGLWEGLSETGFSEIFERFWEVLRGFQRFWEVLRDFSEVLRDFSEVFRDFWEVFRGPLRDPLRGRFPLRGSQSCCP